MSRFRRFLRRNRDKFKYIFTLFSFVLFVLFLYKLYRMGILTNEKALEDFLGKWSFLAPLIFILLRIIISFVPFIPNMIFIIVGYAVFGSIKGLFYNYTASVLAAVFNFLTVKMFGPKILLKSFPEEKIKKYKKQITQSQKKFNRFLFIVSAIPFAPSNFFGMIAALTSIGMKKFLQITLISKIPETMVIGLALKYFRDLII